MPDEIHILQPTHNDTMKSVRFFCRWGNDLPMFSIDDAVLFGSPELRGKATRDPLKALEFLTPKLKSVVGQMLKSGIGYDENREAYRITEELLYSEPLIPTTN